MIRQLWRRALRRFSTSEQQSGAVEIARSAHGIDTERLSPGALRTCETLRMAGFHAYIVGGAVRDLIAGIQPKDFDIATDATPNEVRRLFRRSRIIGRRFQIVHVMQGAETLEVSTFRAAHDTHTEIDEHGRVLRDNVWGTISDDAARRDFTVNALYFEPHRQIVVDYHQGVADLKARRLRMIGQPALRLREDPVRMLRAVRLSAKLRLSMDADLRTTIKQLATLIGNVPAARLFDEMLKLLCSGHSVEALHRLRAEGLHHGLLPLLDVILEQPLGEKFVLLALTNTDQRVRAGKPVSAGFLFATLLWHEVLVNWEKRRAAGTHNIPALFAAMDEVLDWQAEKLAITRRTAADIKDIWLMQPRFDKRNGRAPFRLVEQPRLRAGFDFLLLRAQSGECPQELADWWARFINATHTVREAMLQPEASKKRRRSRSRGRRDNSEPSDDSENNAPHAPSANTGDAQAPPTALAS